MTLLTLSSTQVGVASDCSTQGNVSSRPVAASTPLYRSEKGGDHRGSLEDYSREEELGLTVSQEAAGRTADVRGSREEQSAASRSEH